MVPAILIFAPYRLIFGKSLATYHATQIFAALFIIGLFALLLLFAKKFFPRMSFGVYLTAAFALSLVSILYCTEAPALYCTASSSGLCMEVWSIYFFVRAAWGEDSRRKFLTDIFILHDALPIWLQADDCPCKFFNLADFAVAFKKIFAVKNFYRVIFAVFFRRSGFDGLQLSALRQRV